MKKLWCLLFCMLLLGCPSGGTSDDDSGPIDAGSDVTDAKVKDVSTDTKNPEAGLNFDMWPPTTGDIRYRGGPVLTTAVPVYLIWYGSWNNNSAIPLVEDLVNDLSESPYFNITTTYYENSLVDIQLKNHAVTGKVYASAKLVLMGSSFVGNSLGNSLTDADIFTVVSNAVDNKLVAASSNAIYLVITSADVHEGNLFGGFCNGYCGWHDHKSYNGIDLKFAFIGDPSPCLDTCSAQSKYDEYGIAHSPNNNWAADAMASIIAHELTETITDPVWDMSPSWTDDQSYENADKCAWNYGPVYLTNNGSVANVKLGNRDYLLQQNWLLDGDAGQHCALHP